ncbi:MAG: tyrosine-type recombinase/integrase, partial [Victivallales bacterium]|nr:tyrosine-type recombinase/integrase [Victivallales bacterium]
MASKTAAKGRAKGTGTVFKKGNRFYFQTKTNGVRKSYLLRNENDTPCTTQQQAEEAVARLNKSTLELDTQEKVIMKVAEVRQLKREATTTVRDVWNMFAASPNRRQTSEATTDRNGKIWSAFCDWLGNHGVRLAADITSELAGAYLAEYGADVSARTFNEVLSTLRAIVAEVGSSAGIIDNPFVGIRRRKLETVSRREFTAEQVQRIFDGFQTGFSYKTKVSQLTTGRKRIEYETTGLYTPMNAEEMEVLLKFCCYTGADGETGCLMKWSGIDLAGNTISYVRDKTRKSKKQTKVITLPIHPVLREALEKALTWRENSCPYVLPHVAERYKRNRYGIQKDVQKIIRLATGVEVTEKAEDTQTQRALGACRYSLHSFRHTFASFAINAGVPLPVVQDIIGHGSPIMTLHYSHISTEAKQKAIAALPDMGADVDIKPKDITPDVLRLQIATFVNNAELPDLQMVWHF